MTQDIAFTPLRDLPLDRLEARKAQLLYEIARESGRSQLRLPSCFLFRRWRPTSRVRLILAAALVGVAALAFVPIGGASLGARAVNGISSLWASPPNQPALDRAAEDAENIGGKAYYTDARVNDGANKVDLYLAHAPRSVIDQLRAKHPGIYVIHNDATHTWRQMLRLEHALNFFALKREGIDIESAAPTSDGYLKVGIRGHKDVRKAQGALDKTYGAGIIKVVGGAEPLSIGGGTPAHPWRRAHVSTLTIPAGARGISVIVYGRLSVTTKSGFHIRGLPVRTAALSPDARYVAAGVGHSLVLLAPSGKRLWSHRLAVCPPINGASDCGIISSIAWAPDGSQIAYLDETNTRDEVLHVISRDGTHDTVIDRKARPGQPSWRADSRAIAYLGAGTRLGAGTSPIIYDLSNQSRHVIRWPMARSPETSLAFAPRGDELAIGTESAALLVGRGHRVVWRGPGQTHGVSWLGGRLAVSERVGTTGVTNFHNQIQLYAVRGSDATLVRTVRLPFPILATTREGTLALLGRGRSGRGGILAGSLGSLREVLHYSFVPCDPEACEIPIGDQDISLG
jgi:hypothetical protein